MDNNTILSIGMLGVFGCSAGGLWMLIKGNNRKRGWLMLIMAIVLAANVAILLIPVKA